MRKVSFGLSLAGGIVGLCQGIGNFFSGLFFNKLGFSLFENAQFFDKSDFMLDKYVNLGDKIWLLALPSSIALIAAGILGIIGATTLKKNNKTAGILMLIGGGLCVVGGFHTLVAGLLIAAGILALVKPKQQTPTEE